MLLITSLSVSPLPELPQLNAITARHVIPSSRTTILHLPKASSVTGSSAEFPEQVAGEAPSENGRRRRRLVVAGVDQDELVDPANLADPDSAFYEFNGVQIHHKICRHEEKEDAHSHSTQAAKLGVPIILLHGFGASVFSWNRVMKPLARVTGSKVLAFDRPAFGLTSRSVEVKATMAHNPYSMAFSVLATLSFIDMLGAGKAVLMGHSAGCLVAVNTYFEAPEKVPAMILVAPAIIAPLILKSVDRGSMSKKESQTEDEEVNSSSSSRTNPLARIWRGACRLFGLITGLALQMLKGIRDMITWAFNKALTTLLRSTFGLMLVRVVMDKFGILAIRNSWYDASQVTDHVIQGYTKPLRAKGWEKALLEYIIAMITDSASKSVQPLTKRLAQITCPVLIISGDTDRLVPSWNAKRLSRVIPGSTLEIIKNCGHLPHEEKVDEFVRVVDTFLKRVFAAQ